MLKGGMRTAHNRSLKKSYKNLNAQQTRLVKINERYEAADKFLYGYRGFYEEAGRLDNGQVNWSSIPESLMSAFKDANKDIERYLKQDDDLMGSALRLFNQTQFSFSQNY